jgi:putrescine:ornithine antiporter
MMKAANVADGIYRRNMTIGVVAMIYCVYALYASGGSAVMGGVLVYGLTLIIWGFISNRFTASGAARA